MVTTVAQVNGRKPATPLYEVIDPDALEDLYHHSPLQVSFEYCGYQVTIHPDQTVTVTEF
ncbi:hypothetical protein DMJ13_20535 [halophilic archaeon]|nr:hypothetical protein DMJ13_20535 [halophilic archaeon]